MHNLLAYSPAILAVLLLGTGHALAAEAAQGADGAALSLWWALSFAGLLLSIAVVPQFVPRFWHHHFGKVTAAAAEGIDAFLQKRAAVRG